MLKVVPRVVSGGNTGYGTKGTIGANTGVHTWGQVSNDWVYLTLLRPLTPGMKQNRVIISL